MFRMAIGHIHECFIYIVYSLSFYVTLKVYVVLSFLPIIAPY